MKRYSYILPLLLFCLSLYSADVNMQKFAATSHDQEVGNDLYWNLRKLNKAIADNDKAMKNSLLPPLLQKKQEAFEVAVAAGFPHVASTFQVLGAKVDPILKNVKSIHHEAFDGCIEKVKRLTEILLKHEVGIDIPPLDASLSPPLHLATASGSFEVVQYLIEQGAGVNIRGADGASPIIFAIVNNIPNIFQLLLNCKGVNLDLRQDDGTTPMFWAANYNRLNMLKLLLEKGADPNITDNNGKAPMHVAAEKNRLQMVCALLEKGANPDITRDDDGATPLMLACACGCLSTVKRLVEVGAPINKGSDKLVPPLQQALLAGHLSVASYLLTLEGIDLNVAVGDHMETPLFVASVMGHTYLAQELLEKGADPCLKNSRNESVLHALADKQQSALLRLALQKIPQCQLKDAINERANEGRTPLHYASSEGGSETIAVLLDNGAQVNATDDREKTPLFYACQYGKKSTVKKLLEHGANKTIKDQMGRLPIDIARENRHTGVVRLLERDLKQKNKKGKQEAVQNKEKKKEPKLSLAVSHEEKKEELPQKDAPTTNQDKRLASHASCIVAKSKRGIKVDPAFLFGKEETHAVIKQAWNTERKTLVVYKESEAHDVSSCSIELDSAYKKKDRFHDFSTEVDDYLCYGIKITDPASDLLSEYNCRLSKDGYAIILPGKIAHQYYDYYYVQDDRDKVERGRFDGAFIYLFDKDNRCFHRMFHQSKASKAINNVY